VCACVGAACLAIAALLLALQFGFRYNDNIRYYFFEDLSMVGGLALLVVTAAAEDDIGLDSCRKGTELTQRGSNAERHALLADGEEWDVD